MTISRHVSPGLRSGLMTALGVTLIIGPVILGLSTAAASTGLIVGALTTALGLAGSDDSGRGVLPLSAQATYDAGLSFGLLAAAVAFGAVGNAGALAFFGLLGLAAGLLTARTRYSLATT